MNPRVTIMVPTFNRANLLGECLSSALAQTMADLEVVVVDGASTDATWDICRQYAQMDARVRVFRDPANTGPARGWLRCVEEARGKYGTFLWSDDMLLPSFVERTVSSLEDDSIAFAYTAADIGPFPGQGSTHYAFARSLLTSHEFIHGSLTTNGSFPVSPACGLFRMEDIRRNFTMELPTDPPLDLSTTGAGVDMLLFLLAALERPRVAHIPEPLAFFRAHPDSITIQGRGGLVALSYALTKAWFANEHGMPELVPGILARHWLGAMRDAHRLSSPVAAVRRYRGLTTAGELLTAAVRLAASYGLAHGTRTVAGAFGR